MNLHGKTFRVASTAVHGVVSSDTRLTCSQIGTRVFGRYAGGTIARGCLVGTCIGDSLTFRFVQREASGEIHAGHSTCEVQVQNGRLTIAEHFAWDTREGFGTNVFTEQPD
jgi:hypothetical protein